MPRPSPNWKASSPPARRLASAIPPKPSSSSRPSRSASEALAPLPAFGRTRPRGGENAHLLLPLWGRATPTAKRWREAANGWRGLRSRWLDAAKPYLAQRGLALPPANAFRLAAQQRQELIALPSDL